MKKIEPTILVLTSNKVDLLKHLFIYCLTFFLSANALSDDWGSWDDLPDDLLDNNSAGAVTIEQLFAQLDSIMDTDSAIDLSVWLENLDSRLLIDNEELADLFEDLEGEDAEEIMDELDDWLEDQQKELEDELEDLLDEQEDLSSEDDDNSGSGNSDDPET